MTEAEIKQALGDAILTAMRKRKPKRRILILAAIRTAQARMQYLKATTK